MNGPESKQIRFTHRPIWLQMRSLRCIAACVCYASEWYWWVITQAEGNVSMSEVMIGDIVLYHDPDAGGQVPAVIVKLESQEQAWLNVFTIHGSVALDTPKPRGDQPGQWEPRSRG